MKKLLAVCEVSKSPKDLSLSCSCKVLVCRVGVVGFQNPATLTEKSKVCGRNVGTHKSEPCFQPWRFALRTAGLGCGVVPPARPYPPLKVRLSVVEVNPSIVEAYRIMRTIQTTMLLFRGSCRASSPKKRNTHNPKPQALKS